MFVTFSSLYSFQGVATPSFKIPHVDKAVHFVFYFVACILGVFFLCERTKGDMKLKKAIVVMVVATIVFGIIIEVIQYACTANRQGDFMDGLANSMGSFCGAILVKWYFSGKRQLKWKF